MKILLCTSNSIGSRIIRWMTFSDWSHSAIVDGEEVIEAVWPRVKVSKLNDVIKTHNAYTFIKLPCKNESKALDYAYAQVGKRYDLSALVGWLSNRDWQEDDKWFCSELVAACAAKGGSPLFREGTLSRVSPQHLWMIRP